MHQGGVKSFLFPCYQCREFNSIPKDHMEEKICEIFCDPKGFLILRITARANLSGVWDWDYLALLVWNLTKARSFHGKIRTSALSIMWYYMCYHSNLWALLSKHIAEDLIIHSLQLKIQDKTSKWDHTLVQSCHGFWQHMSQNFCCCQSHTTWRTCIFS